MGDYYLRESPIHPLPARDENDIVRTSALHVLRDKIAHLVSSGIEGPEESALLIICEMLIAPHATGNETTEFMPPI